MRTPQQIIGDNAVTQLIFEGYKIVRLSRCGCGNDIEDDADVCKACGLHEDFGPNTSARKRENALRDLQRLGQELERDKESIELVAHRIDELENTLALLSGIDLEVIKNSKQLGELISSDAGNQLMVNEEGHLVHSMDSGGKVDRGADGLLYAREVRNNVR